jgi:type II secretory pathway pseudopilin PulG
VRPSSRTCAVDSENSPGRAPSSRDPSARSRRLGLAVKAKGVRRWGYSLLEVQVAFAILGIATAGLTPFVIMQLRQVRQLELRLQAQVTRNNTSNGTPQTMFTGQTYYIVPWTNPWSQKVAGSAQVVTSPANPCDPGPLTPHGSATTTYPVNILELDAQPGNQSVTAYVDVFAP